MEEEEERRHERMIKGVGVHYEKKRSKRVTKKLEIQILHERVTRGRGNEYVKKEEERKTK